MLIFNSPMTEDVIHVVRSQIILCQGCTVLQVYRSNTKGLDFVSASRYELTSKMHVVIDNYQISVCAAQQDLLMLKTFFKVLGWAATNEYFHYRLIC